MPSMGVSGPRVSGRDRTQLSFSSAAATKGTRVKGGRFSTWVALCQCGLAAWWALPRVGLALGREKEPLVQLCWPWPASAPLVKTLMCLALKKRFLGPHPSLLFFEAQEDPYFSVLCVYTLCLIIKRGFLHSSVGKESACSAGDLGSIPEWGRNGNPLQYSCLENPMDRGAWQA